MNLDELEAAEQAEIAAKKKKNRKFSIFNRQKKDRPDVLPQDEYKGHDLKGFFIRYKRNFTKLVYVNFLIIFGNFPLWFLLIALSGAFKIDFTTPMSEIFPALHASSLLGDGVTPAQLLQYGIYGMQSPTTAMTATSYVFLGLSALTVFTFGIVNVGTTYRLNCSGFATDSATELHAVLNAIPAPPKGTGRVLQINETTTAVNAGNPIPARSGAANAGAAPNPATPSMKLLKNQAITIT